MRAHRTRAAVLAVPLALLLLSCSGGTGTPADGGTSPHADATPSAPVDPVLGGPTETAEEHPNTTVLDIHESGTATPWSPTPGPEAVRDAFAGLQATYTDSCSTPGNCEYFLGRVLEELEGLDAAMKADPKGPGHFPEPIAWIASMRKELGDDRSFENLKKHQSLLLGTRDRINTWMQDHPDDYR